jgi:hypothetical protein
MKLLLAPIAAAVIETGFGGGICGKPADEIGGKATARHYPSATSKLNKI